MSKLDELAARAERGNIKINISSESKVGKSYGICGFPTPLIIDTEHGLDEPQYKERAESTGGKILFTTDMNEVIDVTKEVMQRPYINGKPIRTFVVDSATVIYDEELFTNFGKFGDEYQRHKNPTDRLMKHMMTMVLRMPMTVIVTNHIKAKWEGGKEVGKINAGYAKTDYYCDLNLELQKRGNDRIAVVRGSRYSKLPQGTEFEWSYENLASILGRERFEGEVKAVKLATPEQVTMLETLLANRTDAVTLAEKWLKKAESDNFSEMTDEIITKCINFLKEGSKE